MAAFLGLAAGCATKKPSPSNYTVFPPPPDEPRIQYLMSFGSESDLGGPSKFSEFIVGAQREFRPIWKPYGVTIRDGKVYVCDTQAANVSISDLAKRKVEYLKPGGQAAMKLPINIAVDKVGNVYIEKKAVNLVELQTYLSNKFRVNTNVPVYISGDKDATHGMIIGVLDLVRRQGIQKVSFAIAPQPTKQ